MLEGRVDIYSTVLGYTSQIAFNEMRLAYDHSNKNNNKVIRAIVSFKHAKMLVSAISQEYIIRKKKLVVDISKFVGRNHSHNCYLTLDVFRSGTT